MHEHSTRIDAYLLAVEHEKEEERRRALELEQQREERDGILARLADRGHEVKQTATRLTEDVRAHSAITAAAPEALQDEIERVGSLRRQVLPVRVAAKEFDSGTVYRHEDLTLASNSTPLQSAGLVTHAATPPPATSGPTLAGLHLKYAQSQQQIIEKPPPTPLQQVADVLQQDNGSYAAGTSDVDSAWAADHPSEAIGEVAADSSTASNSFYYDSQSYAYASAPRPAPAPAPPTAVAAVVPAKAPLVSSMSNAHNAQLHQPHHLMPGIASLVAMLQPKSAPAPQLPDGTAVEPAHLAVTPVATAAASNVVPAHNVAATAIPPPVRTVQPDQTHRSIHKSTEPVTPLPPPPAPLPQGVTPGLHAPPPSTRSPTLRAPVVVPADVQAQQKQRGVASAAMAAPSASASASHIEQAVVGRHPSSRVVAAQQLPQHTVMVQAPGGVVSGSTSAEEAAALQPTTSVTSSRPRPVLHRSVDLADPQLQPRTAHASPDHVGKPIKPRSSPNKVAPIGDTLYWQQQVLLQQQQQQQQLKQQQAAAEAAAAADIARANLAQQPLPVAQQKAHDYQQQLHDTIGRLQGAMRSMAKTLIAVSPPSDAFNDNSAAILRPVHQHISRQHQQPHRHHHHHVAGHADDYEPTDSEGSDDGDDRRYDSFDDDDDSDFSTDVDSDDGAGGHHRAAHRSESQEYSKWAQLQVEAADELESSLAAGLLTDKQMDLFFRTMHPDAAKRFLEQHARQKQQRQQQQQQQQQSVSNRQPSKRLPPSLAQQQQTEAAARFAPQIQDPDDSIMHIVDQPMSKQQQAEATNNGQNDDEGGVGPVDITGLGPDGDNAVHRAYNDDDGDGDADSSGIYTSGDEQDDDAGDVEGLDRDQNEPPLDVHDEAIAVAANRTAVGAAANAQSSAGDAATARGNRPGNYTHSLSTGDGTTTLGDAPRAHNHVHAQIAPPPMVGNMADDDTDADVDGDDRTIGADDDDDDGDESVDSVGSDEMEPMSEEQLALFKRTLIPQSSQAALMNAAAATAELERTQAARHARRIARDRQRYAAMAMGDNVQSRNSPRSRSSSPSPRRHASRSSSRSPDARSTARRHSPTRTGGYGGAASGIQISELAMDEYATQALKHRKMISTESFFTAIDMADVAATYGGTSRIGKRALKAMKESVRRQKAAEADEEAATLDADAAAAGQQGLFGLPLLGTGRKTSSKTGSPSGNIDFGAMTTGLQQAASRATSPLKSNANVGNVAATNYSFPASPPRHNANAASSGSNLHINGGTMQIQMSPMHVPAAAPASAARQIGVNDSRGEYHNIGAPALLPAPPPRNTSRAETSPGATAAAPVPPPSSRQQSLPAGSRSAAASQPANRNGTGEDDDGNDGIDVSALLMSQNRGGGGGFASMESQLAAMLEARFREVAGGLDEDDDL